MKKLFSIFLTALLIAFSSGLNTMVLAGDLSMSTPIVIKSENPISLATNQEGDIVDFSTVFDIVDNTGHKVIPSGTLVQGKIIELEPKNRIGRPANLRISDFSAVLDNGQTINFQGILHQKSESRMARSIVLSVIFLPFFLFMKGKDVELPSGTQTTVYPANDYSL